MINGNLFAHKLVALSLARSLCVFARLRVFTIFSHSMKKQKTN